MAQIGWKNHFFNEAWGNIVQAPNNWMQIFWLRISEIFFCIVVMNFFHILGFKALKYLSYPWLQKTKFFFLFCDLKRFCSRISDFLNHQTIEIEFFMVITQALKKKICAIWFFSSNFHLKAKLLKTNNFFIFRPWPQQQLWQTDIVYPTKGKNSSPLIPKI